MQSPTVQNRTTARKFDQLPTPASISEIGCDKTAWLRVALYARYSLDLQRPTSIDDQVRMCREVAQRFGMKVDDDLIFYDEAVSGQSHKTHKRSAYQQLRELVRAGKIDVLICDQQCRLARSARESLDFLAELHEHKVRLLTADGFDSEQPSAKLIFGMKSVFSEFFIDETRHRVSRTMLGEFERGAMVTAIPYGYAIDQARSTAEGRCCWCVKADEAAVVREIFARRKDGMTLQEIAAVLNSRGVPTPRQTSDGKRLYWRGSAIWRIFGNPMYKGLYLVNFGRSNSSQERNLERFMPELVLVSPDDWDAVQSMGKRSPSASESAVISSHLGQKRTYGGGKHAFSGVFRCGTCGVYLSFHPARGNSAGTLHCIQCEHASREGQPGRQPIYISVKGVRIMMRWLMQKILSKEVIAAYRERLKEKLAGGHEQSLQDARTRLHKADAARQRLARLLKDIGSEDPVLERQYLEAREDTMRLQHEVSELEQHAQAVNTDAMRRQLNIPLDAVVDAFLSDDHAPERTRAVLNRVFPSIVLRAKPGRYEAVFEIHAMPGALLAEASETALLVDGHEVLWVCLRTSGSRYPDWSVELLDPPPLPVVTGNEG